MASSNTSLLVSAIAIACIFASQIPFLIKLSSTVSDGKYIDDRPTQAKEEEFVLVNDMLIPVSTGSKNTRKKEDNISKLKRSSMENTVLVNDVLLPLPSSSESTPKQSIESSPKDKAHSVERKQQLSNLSLGVLTHLQTVFPSEDILENQITSLTSGWDSSAFQYVIVLYDDKGMASLFDSLNVTKEEFSTRTDKKEMSGNWVRFINKMQQLQSKGLISKYIPLKMNASIPTKMGSKDDRGEDSAMYAIYQFVIEECSTQFCAFLTHDIMAHGGGGLNEAVHMLERDSDLVFAIPPLARNHPTLDIKNDKSLRELFVKFDETKPYNSELGIIRPWELKSNNVTLCKRENMLMSTRYFVTPRDRFVRSLPFKPLAEENDWFENHDGANKVAAGANCQKSGYLVHPPPWHHGDHLFKSCGNISTLQQVVDRPDYLVVDYWNNMIMENWTAACHLIHLISNSTQSEPKQMSTTSIGAVSG